MRISKYIPSMYQRRLLLFVCGMGVIGFFPAARMAQLTLAKGDELRAEAEKRLISREWLDNVRGEIRDRKGRVLALDRPAMDIAVDYPVITGEWADAQAARKARSENRGRWTHMSPEQRDAAIKALRPEFDAQVERVWDAIAINSGVSREQLEARRGEIRDEVQLLATQITERKRQEREQLKNRDSDPGDDEQWSQVLTADVRRPVKEETESHVILRNVPDELGFKFQKLVRETFEAPGGRVKAMYPGLRVNDAKRREYPLDTVEVPVQTSLLPTPLRKGRDVTVRVEGVATHVVGWMREKPFKEDVDRRPMIRDDGSIDLGHYRAGDGVGHAGFEAAAEDELRGLRGVRLTHLDTGDVEITAPTDGRGVTLTIDALLQARVQALFHPELGLTMVQPWHKTPQKEPPKFQELPVGTVLNGAVVVIDVESGDILAMVTTPSFSHEQLRHDPASIATDAYSSAYQNRAIDRAYPPGSIVKPLMLTAAVTQGVFGVDDRVNCIGHFYPDKPLLYRCWIYKQRNTTHNDQLGHAPDGSDAIKVSCNIFFFEMGRRLGPSGIQDWYEKFGVGENAEAWNLFGLPGGPAKTGLLHELRGKLGGSAAMTGPEAVLMGIGQGPIVWTPLHAADAYATLARGGVKLTPRLRADAPQSRTDLKLNPRSLAKALDGLRRSANEESGTTYQMVFEGGDGTKFKERVFNVPGVSVWAKSGTADAPPFVADLNFDQNAETFDGDHAWCVALAGVGTTPKYAIAVVIDHGGSGGRVAGPVANQVINALVSEGYLPDQRGEASAGGGF